MLRLLLENDVQLELAMQDMFEIGKKIKKTITPTDLVKKNKQDENTGLSSQEMLKVSQNISLYFSPRIEFNKPKLTLLPVDPQHLYAYWVLDGQSSNKLAYSMLNDELVLRIYSRSQAEDGVEKNLSVEKTIHDFQSQQLIKLPVSEQVIDYSASIGKLNTKKAFNPLLKSNTMTAQQKPVPQMESHEHREQLIAEDVLSEVAGPVKSHYASHNPSGQAKKQQL